MLVTIHAVFELPEFLPQNVYRKYPNCYRNLEECEDTIYNLRAKFILKYNISEDVKYFSIPYIREAIQNKSFDNRDYNMKFEVLDNLEYKEQRDFQDPYHNFSTTDIVLTLISDLKKIGVKKDERLIFFDYHLYELTQEEIAINRKISLKTVYNKLKRTQIRIENNRHKISNTLA